MYIPICPFLLYCDSWKKISAATSPWNVFHNFLGSHSMLQSGLYLWCVFIVILFLFSLGRRWTCLGYFLIGSFACLGVAISQMIGRLPLLLIYKQYSLLMFSRNVTITQQYLERVRILKWVCKDTIALLTQCEAQSEISCSTFVVVVFISSFTLTKQFERNFL